MLSVSVSVTFPGIRASHGGVLELLRLAQYVLPMSLGTLNLIMQLVQSPSIPCREIMVPEGSVPREQGAGSQLCQEVSTLECHSRIFKVAEQYTPGLEE